MYAGAAYSQPETSEPGIDSRLSNERVFRHVSKIVPNPGSFEKRFSPI
jgi:hypothetical protein